jgi:molybdate transport system ATP-binding protein
MILGDHPKMYTNDIHIFGQRPGIGMSVFDIQAQMGHSSPEIHRHFPRYQTGQQCLASAFAESFLPKAALSENEQKLIDQIAAYFYVAGDLDSQLRDMAPAKQRLFLLLRALVKMPRLIVLDEPFAGMDADMIERAKVYLDTQLSQEQSLIFVTHYDDEVPSTVSRRLRLDGGSVVEQV